MERRRIGLSFAIAFFSIFCFASCSQPTTTKIRNKPSGPTDSDERPNASKEAEYVLSSVAQVVENQQLYLRMILQRHLELEDLTVLTNYSSVDETKDLQINSNWSKGDFSYELKGQVSFPINGKNRVEQFEKLKVFKNGKLMDTFSINGMTEIDSIPDGGELLHSKEAAYVSFQHNWTYARESEPAKILASFSHKQPIKARFHESGKWIEKFDLSFLTIQVIDGFFSGELVTNAVATATFYHQCARAQYLLDDTFMQMKTPSIKPVREKAVLESGSQFFIFKTESYIFQKGQVTCKNLPH
jgi:hypothetical protein